MRELTRLMKRNEAAISVLSRLSRNRTFIALLIISAQYAAMSGKFNTTRSLAKKSIGRTSTRAGSRSIITRLPAQKSACKDLGRHGQERAITPKAAYTPTSTHAGSRSIITRSPAQKPACKDLGRNGQSPAITPKATYTPVSNRAGSRSIITRSPAQKSACKDLSRNGQSPAITSEATYTPTS
ncbi:hypothetical protein, partial [Lacticaseibacillus rhamnosus]|uniref:hypothetical protein n=1 Tax=Lacticaseibacillus rhamnosus TaxID=47715 RepID=UPI00157C2003